MNKLRIRAKNIRGNNGKAIPHQIIITTPDKTVFQSFSSTIVVIDNKTNKTYLDKKYWNYSITTSKYRNIFLDETTNEILKKIKTKEYILIDLNG